MRTIALRVRTAPGFRVDASKLLPAPLAAQPQFGFALGQSVDEARGKIIAEGFLDAAPAALLDQQPHNIRKHHRDDRRSHWNHYGKPPAEGE